jgi:hypothetical protein
MCFNLQKEDDHKQDSTEQLQHSKYLLSIRYIQDP